jgi:hypothetical protein
MESTADLELDDRRHALDLAYARYMRGFRANAGQQDLDRLKNEYIRRRIAGDQIARQP